jgi:hypothetical protein
MTNGEAKEFIAQSVKSDVDMALIADAIKALEQEPTTKNDLGVGLISKEQTIDRVLTYFNHIDKGNDDEWAKGYEAGEEDAIAVIESMPSVTPQEPQSFKWCTDCKEYDQEKHCCHRYSKVIRDTVEEMKQEPFINKPCISRGVCEHIKQNVLDKLRAEMLEEMLSHSGTGEEVIQAYADGLKKGLEFIDKYKAEIEPQESEEQTDES